MYLRKKGKLLVSALLVAFLISMLSLSVSAADSWTTKANMPTGRSALVVVEVNGKIYAIGGVFTTGYADIVEEYDPVTNTWTPKASTPTKRYRAAGVAFNGKIYVIGGSSDTASNTGIVEEYDPSSDTWTTKASMPTGRSGLGVAIANNKIYALGGANTSGNLATVEEYDPVTDTWTSKPGMPDQRAYFSSVTVNNKIYVIGGTISGSYTTSVKVYDPVDNTWTTKASLSTARGVAASTLVGGKIYTIGGYYGGLLKRVEEYDISTDTWTTKTDMPTARNWLGAAVVNKKIYVIGGIGVDSATVLNTVEEYTPPIVIPATPSDLIATSGNAQVSLSWSEASDAQSYNIKRSIEAGGPYTTIQTDVITATYTDTTVSNGTTYYYVVTAVNTEGESSNSNEALATPSAPQSPPSNLIATSGNAQVSLTWCEASDAQSYIVKRSTLAGGPYTTIQTEITTTTHVDTTVSNGTTYYYVVTAVNTTDESSNSNEVSATPTAPQSVGRSLLVIIMINGFEKEYDLSMTEVDAFIDWYDGRATGIGNAYYIFDKSYNIGPFQSRKDYIVFDKILNFELMQYE